jgi:hypothetical protein
MCTKFLRKFHLKIQRFSEVSDVIMARRSTGTGLLTVDNVVADIVAQRDSETEFMEDILDGQDSENYHVGPVYDGQRPATNITKGLIWDNYQLHRMKV